MGRILFPNDEFGQDMEKKRKAHAALEKAKNTELNKRRTVPKYVGNGLTIYITPEQDNDPAFMKRFNKRWETR